MPHVRQSHAIKHVLYYGVRQPHTQKFRGAFKNFWNIITKVAHIVCLQLWQQSHWPGSSVSEECSKSEHLNGDLPVLSAPIAVFRSKLP